MTIPYGVTAVALFCLPPQATGIAQALYIFVTYNLCTTVVYTAAQPTVSDDGTAYDAR